MTCQHRRKFRRFSLMYICIWWFFFFLLTCVRLLMENSGQKGAISLLRVSSGNHSSRHTAHHGTLLTGFFQCHVGMGRYVCGGKGNSSGMEVPLLAIFLFFLLKKKKKGKPNYLQSKLIIAQRFDTTVCDVTGKLVGAHQLSLRWLQVWGQRMCGARASAHVLWVLQGTATHCWLWWWQLPPASADLLLQVCDWGCGFMYPFFGVQRV